VAGSAQRKMRGALLQHGSILLHRSEYVPHLAGINDRPAQRNMDVPAGTVESGDAVGAPKITPEELAGELKAAFAADTGWSITPGEWTAEELSRTAAIRSEKYANPAWNEKR
jgi:lipoate-protein ligase A